MCFLCITYFSDHELRECLGSSCSTVVTCWTADQCTDPGTDPAHGTYMIHTAHRFRLSLSEFSLAVQNRSQKHHSLHFSSVVLKCKVRHLLVRCDVNLIIHKVHGLHFRIVVIPMLTTKRRYKATKTKYWYIQPAKC